MRQRCIRPSRELRNFHPDLQRYLNEHGLEDACVMTGVTRAQGGNRTVAELKAEREQEYDGKPSAWSLISAGQALKSNKNYIFEEYTMKQAVLLIDCYLYGTIAILGRCTVGAGLSARAGQSPAQSICTKKVLKR